MLRNFAKPTIILILLALILAGITWRLISTRDPIRHARSNVLLIMLDDLGYNDVGIYTNNQATPTQNLNDFARQGVRFMRHYSDSTCSPSRAALLSGQYPARRGFRPNGRGLSPDVITLADRLKAAGYSTHHVGKWHLGDTTERALPHHQGFDTWFGFLSQWRLQGAHRNDEIVLATPTYHDPWLENEQGLGKKHEGHLTDILTAHVKAEIQERQHQDQPWFINVWTYAPHEPIAPAHRYKIRFPDTPAGKYLALIQQMDEGIGKILGVLEDTGQADNTIVLILSDNGGTNKPLNNNAPLFGRKTLYREGGIRTPCMIRWPGRLPENHVIEQSITIYDIYPTLMGMLNLEVPAGLDGIDISPAFSDNVLSERDLFWEIHTGDRFGYSVLSKQRWRLHNGWPWIRWNQPVELFDLALDPTGHTGVKSNRENIVRDLYGRYVDWHRDVHTLKLRHDIDQDGRTYLAGDDFQRSPGFGGFTFGIAVDTQNAPQAADIQTLAEQDGLWKLSITPEMGLHAVFDRWQVKGGTLIDNRCNSIIVTADFERRTTHWARNDDTVNIQLYLNEKLIDSIELQAKLAEPAQLSAPTFIGSNAQGKEKTKFIMSAPIVLNTRLTAFTPINVKSLHQQLCSDGQGDN